MYHNAICGLKNTVLKLGRRKRLFNKAQRLAIILRDRHCLGCGHVLGVVEQHCRTCAAFVCGQCDELTTRNGGDGHICSGCMRSSA